MNSTFCILIRASKIGVIYMIAADRAKWKKEVCYLCCQQVHRELMNMYPSKQEQMFVLHEGIEMIILKFITITDFLNTRIAVKGIIIWDSSCQDYATYQKLRDKSDCQEVVFFFLKL